MQATSERVSTAAKRAVLLLVTSLSAACAHGSEAPPLPNDVGPPVSIYPILAPTPRGMVHVISLGREMLASDPQHPRSYLHLRLAAVNGSDDQTWSFDPREQVVHDGDRMVPPAFSESSTGQPVVTLGRGARGFLDLYYPTLAPAGKEPARIALAWRLRRGSEHQTMVAANTEFSRVPDESSSAVYQPADEEHLVAGLGSRSWWWNDYYFWNDQRGWHPYRQSDFHRRYPNHQAQWDAERRRQATAESELVTRNTDGIYWRGPRGDVGNTVSSPSVETSSWRGTPPSESVSSSPISTPTSSGSSAAPSGGGGDGKSSWRGGSGP
jgi:hypothetical protein